MTKATHDWIGDMSDHDLRRMVKARGRTPRLKAMRQRAYGVLVARRTSRARRRKG